MGLGDADRLDRTRLGNALHLGLNRLSGRRGALAVAWNPALEPVVTPSALAEAAVEAAVLAGFSQATHRSVKAGDRPVEKLTLAGFPRLDRRRLEAAEVLARATNVARGLVNAPASELTPTALAAEARRRAGEAGLSFDRLGEKELRRLGYGSILAVGAGSAEPAVMAVMTYRAAGGAEGKARRRRRRLLALVGKGVTFDSGGVSIKPGADMHYMKGDMGGAAAVIGAMMAIGRLKPPIDVVGIVCAAENMLSGSAMRPGDVVRSGSGQTIEVLNTDAEGRMVLADGIHHAVKLGATDIIDIATLTGGQRIALGPVAAAFMTDAPPLGAALRDAAAEAGERVWELPTYAEYESMLESPIADLNNSPGPQASAITAGLFLRRFAGGRPWLHIDMAAPSWNRVGAVKEIPQGPTGFGVRTLIRLAQGLVDPRGRG